MRLNSIGIRLIIGVAFIICVLRGATVFQSTNAKITINQSLTKALNNPKNVNGQLYGSATDSTSIETIPDLILAGSVDGTVGYLLKKDYLGEQPEDVPLYDVNGKTIIGSFHIRGQNAPIYPKNENRQTYGSSADATSPYTEPDLIKTYGVEGTIGYVLKKDLDGVKPRNPEEAIALQKSRPAGGRDIPLYDVDGKIVIGVFHIE
jgi:hypothetical protein